MTKDRKSGRIKRTSMLKYKIRDKQSGTIILISCQHFGFDPQVKKIRWHGLFSSPSLSDTEENLERLNREHKFCIKFPWLAKFNKNLYEN